MRYLDRPSLPPGGHAIGTLAFFQPLWVVRRAPWLTLLASCGSCHWHSAYFHLLWVMQQLGHPG
eukprot:238560-Pelagomonas_calceolata.AAC.1